MTTKTIVTTSLLAFVAVSIGVLIARSSQDAPGGDQASRDRAAAEAAASEGNTGTEGALAGERASGSERVVLVSYLHGAAQCRACQVLQEYATRAVEEHFAEALADGTMEFRVLNVATPEHAHLAQRYGLFTQSVIVSELRGEEELRWKNLDRVWSLLRDEEAYFEYVRGEVEEFWSRS